MKNDTTFVRMRSGDHLGNAKCRKRLPLSVKFNFLINCDKHKRFSQNETRRADLQDLVSDFFSFLPRDLGMIFQNLMVLLHLFWTLKDHI